MVTHLILVQVFKVRVLVGQLLNQQKPALVAGFFVLRPIQVKNLCRIEVLVRLQTVTRNSI